MNIKKYIKLKVEKAAFQSYLEAKERSKKKMHQLQYNTLGIQCYLTDSSFSHNEIKLLFSLRSNCYPVKMNFRKMNKWDLKCSFKCDEFETQVHVFENCEPIKKKLNFSTSVKLECIFGTVSEQKSAVSLLSMVDIIRKQMKNEILPGRSVARTHVISDY